MYEDLIARRGFVAYLVARYLHNNGSFIQPTEHQYSLEKFIEYVQMRIDSADWVY
ncbi:predicted protein [Botrytis cinerea T4]|uniref:Uncharacterized protein n=1 Tax=Botryotinia fuckeliana (strain T4) TaxID=999810 RepID=G2Y3A2_BOTF4|nr:predicted protein [Botrytis cinerea T4]